MSLSTNPPDSPSGNKPLKKRRKEPNRKTPKPVIERKRRARINTSLTELESLLGEGVIKSKAKPRKNGKVEKADILEIAVNRLRELTESGQPQARGWDENDLNFGFQSCLDRVSIHLRTDPSGQNLQLLHGLLQDMGNPAEQDLHKEILLNPCRKEEQKSHSHQDLAGKGKSSSYHNQVSSSSSYSPFSPSSSTWNTIPSASFCIPIPFSDKTNINSRLSFSSSPSTCSSLSPSLFSPASYCSWAPTPAFPSSSNDCHIDSTTTTTTIRPSPVPPFSPTHSPTPSPSSTSISPSFPSFQSYPPVVHHTSHSVHIPYTCSSSASPHLRHHFRPTSSPLWAPHSGSPPISSTTPSSSSPSSPSFSPIPLFISPAISSSIVSSLDENNNPLFTSPCSIPNHPYHEIPLWRPF